MVLAAGVVEALVLDIHARHVAHLPIACGHLLDKLAVHAVEVDVAVAVALAGDEHLLLGLLASAHGDELPGVGHLDVGLVLLVIQHLDFVRCLSVHAQDLHVALQTVHAHECQRVGVGPLEAGDVFPRAVGAGFGRQRGHEEALLVLHVVDAQLHPAVVLAGLGVLVLVILWV